MNYYQIKQQDQQESSLSMNKKEEKYEVYLLNSVYKNRPSTIFFQYPKQACNKRDTSRTIKLTEEEAEKLNLKYKMLGTNPYKCVLAAFQAAGFQRTYDDDWICFWGIMLADSQKFLQKHQKNNHFPGCWNCGRKDKLWIHLSSARRRFQNEYNFVPNTYLMQYDFEKIKTVLQEADQNDIFILKPVDQAKGQGIKIVSKKDKIKKNKNYLISHYIKDPHLINGLKYDLRIYVLVTSYDPLKIYIYKDGLCRFATEKYDITKLKQKFSHLTNYSVNKQNSNFVQNKDAEQDGSGSKWSLSALKKEYNRMGIDYEQLFKKIDDVIIKTLICLEPHQQGGCYKKSCFELYGFDILIDSQLKPWLLEINVCCSLSSASPIDKKIKYGLISDVLNLVGFNPYDHEQMAKIENDEKIYGNNKKDKISVAYNKTSSNLQDLDINNCLQKLDSSSWLMLFELDEENYRKGQFNRVFPIKENVDYYQQFFQFQRYNNLVIQKYLKQNQNILTKICEQISYNNV